MDPHLFKAVVDMMVSYSCIYNNIQSANPNQREAVQAAQTLATMMNDLANYLHKHHTEGRVA